MERYDFNTVYSTLAERIAAARSALRATSFGRGGVISIVEEGDRVKFKIPLLNKTFDDIFQAVQAAAGLSVSETFTFEGGKSAIKSGNKMNAAASVFESVYEKLQNLTPDQKKMLEEANINIKDLKSLNFSLSTLRAEKGGVSAVVANIEKLRERGTMGGISIIDDEGARVIQFKANKKILSEYQTNLILSITGHGQLNPALFEDLLRSGEPGKLAKNLAKLAKRQRGIFSERDLSLVGDELTKFLTRGKDSLNLRQATLVLDPQYELLKIFASPVIDPENVEGISKAARAFYSYADPEAYFGRIIKQAQSSMGDDTIAELKVAINEFSIDRGNKDWASDQLSVYLKENFVNGDAQRKKLVSDIFSAIEYGDDGSTYLNANYIKSYRNKIDKEIRMLKDEALSPGISASKKEANLLKVSELESLRSNLGDIDNLQQVTGRGNLPGLGGIKTAFEVKNFDTPRLNRYAMIVSKFDLKRETDISGNLPQLILSGLGQGSTDVYVDPISAVFHPEIFADRQSIDAILDNGRSVLAEFQEAVDSNTLPERVVNQLKMSSNQSVEQLPSALRQSALRNREFAQKLLELHRSGASVKTSPQMMNMLHSFYATQAYREKDGFRQAILPETYRFAIDTERSGVSVTDRRLLGPGFENLKGMKFGQEVVNIDQDILKFRVTGHKMLMSPQAIAELRHSLGGFDLDDKAIPRLRTYVDNEGKNRLGFYILRQPSGPEESIFARAIFDSDTVKALFGKRNFEKTLDKMMKGESPSEALTSLNQILKGSLASGYDEDAVEQAAVSVLEQMEKDNLTTLGRLTEKQARAIQEYGSSSLRVDLTDTGGVDLDDYLPAYKNKKIFRVLGESNAFTLSDEIVNVIQSAPINKKLRQQLLAAGNDFPRMMEILADANFANNPQAQAILATAFGNAAKQRAKQSGGILGQYINRSMFAGSVLNQYEDMYNQIGDTKIRNFLAENYNIGLLSQEEAIDSSINFTGSRTLNTELMRRISGSVSVDEDKLAAAVAELTKMDKNGKRVVTLDTVGEQIITNLGKLAGFSKGLDVSDNLKIGIDTYLMESRLKGGDIERLAQGVLAGMADAKKMGLGGTALDDEMIKVSKLLEEKNETDIKNYLLKMIGLGPESSYANLSRLQEAGLLLEKYFDSTRKMSLSSMGRDEILASASTSPEAKRIAKKILEDNRAQFDALAEITREQLKDMSEEQKIARRIMTDDLGKRVFDQIKKATEVGGVSMEYIVNALDQANAGTYRDILALGGVTEEGQEMFEKISQAQRLRRIKYYQKFDQEAAQTIRAVLQDVKLDEPLTMDLLKARAKKAMEAFQSLDDIEGTVEEGIYKTLMEEASSIDDDIIRQEAQQQAEILRAMIDADELEDVRASLEAKGEVTAANISEDADEELRKLINLVNETEDSGSARPAVYKRITEKVNDFKNLFKEDKLIRRGTLAIAALAIGSLAYSEIRDRTVDDITGPPLLPGGNPYEQDYPIRGYQVGDFGSRGYSQGSSYQVSIQGGRDEIERFNEAARGLVNGNISTTIYNNIPNMRRDPYSAMGQSF